MTFGEAVALLTCAGVEDASHDVREIMEALDGVPRNCPIPSATTLGEEARAAIMRRKEREPLQYILGYAYFYREKYVVNPSCLIPRQETELLVDYAVKNLPCGSSFFDLCTGSGCIAVSVLKNSKCSHAYAVDISKDTLALAQKNAEANGVKDRIDFICADVLCEAISRPVYAVLSNPPYVSCSSYQTLAPEIAAEPKIAFVGGEDGADFYRRLTALYKGVIDIEGFILYEIGFDQGDILRLIAEENGMSCEIIKDYSSQDRLAILKLK